MTVGKGALSPLPDEMAHPVVARGLDRGEKLPLIHTFVKHLPYPEVPTVPTGHVRLMSSLQTFPKDLAYETKRSEMGVLYCPEKSH